MLNESELAAVVAALTVEAGRLQQQSEHLAAAFDDLVAGADVEPADDEHDPDGTTAYERAQVVSLRRAALARLREVDQALAAAGETTFGACAGCRRTIAIERLHAPPGPDRSDGCASN